MNSSAPIVGAIREGEAPAKPGRNTPADTGIGNRCKGKMMALKARTVLNDCREAHMLLEAELDTVRFRILWVAGVALLRAVGHVLKKVDAEPGSTVEVAVADAYDEWQRERAAHVIFWDFIEKERNNVLKEYQIGFFPGPVNVSVHPGGETFFLDENLFCPIPYGRFAGEDCRDVMAEAIAWWERQLDAIETAAGA